MARALSSLAVDQTHRSSGLARTSTVPQDVNQFEERSYQPGHSSSEAVNRFILYQPAQPIPFSTSPISNLSMEHPTPDSSRDPNDVNDIKEVSCQFGQSSRQTINITSPFYSDDNVPPTPVRRPPSDASPHMRVGTSSLSPLSPSHLAPLTPQHALAALPLFVRAEPSQERPSTQANNFQEAIRTPLSAFAGASETLSSQTTHVSRTVGVQVDSLPQPSVCTHLDTPNLAEVAIQVEEPPSTSTQPDQRVPSGGELSKSCLSSLPLVWCSDSCAHKTQTLY